MNGDNKDVWDTEVKSVPLEIQGHTMMLDFHVMHITQADVVLSRAWLHGVTNINFHIPKRISQPFFINRV